MTAIRNDLTALLGSRICHDLISPLSAIGNGVELLELSGAVKGPEMTLISESVDNANARIRFFRVAFGAAAADQYMPEREVLDILGKMTAGSRFDIDWAARGDQLRREVKLAFLILQCFETAMPWGGDVRVARSGNDWRIAGMAERMRIDTALWDVLTATESNRDIAPAEVQFLLTPLTAAELGRTLQVSATPERISFTF